MKGRGGGGFGWCSGGGLRRRSCFCGPASLASLGGPDAVASAHKNQNAPSGPQKNLLRLLKLLVLLERRTLRSAFGTGYAALGLWNGVCCARPLKRGTMRFACQAGNLKLKLSRAQGAAQ